MEKIIYLDQNHWIDLFEAKEGYSNHNHYIFVKELLKDNFIFPLSRSRIIETLSHGDVRETKKKRKRDAEIDMMRDISNEYWIPEMITISDMEIEFFLRGKRNLQDSLKQEVIRKDLDGIMGETVKKTWDGSICEGRLLDFLKSHHGKSTIDRIRQYPEGAVVRRIDGLRELLLFYANELEYPKEKVIKDIFKSKTETRLRIFFEDYRKKGIVQKTLADMGYVLLYDKLQEMDTLEDFYMFPSYYTFYRMMFDSVLDYRNRDTDSNDWNDLKTLAVAIPYGDIVITEKYFCQVANKARLDERFNTIIRYDLDCLEDII